MRVLYLDCGMGAAGDMLTAALLELLPDPAGFTKKLNALGVPGVEYCPEPSVKCGITGTHMSVLVHGAEEGAEHAHDHEHAHHHDHGHHHDHEHDHDHEHHHHDHAGHTHYGMHDIEHIVRGHMSIPESVQDDILAVYGLIADAESAVHGVPVTDIHFHEVGSLDAVADVAAVCLLMHEIAPDEVVCSPVHVGSGEVKCAHGILPVPAPATARILEGVPIYGGKIRGELCTPTGAALLKHFVTRFGDMPVMRTEKTGYGMGKKDFEAANCVRAMLGESGTTDDCADTALPSNADDHGIIYELSANVDDMIAEAVAYACERILEGGAREVYTVPVGMKKGRPGTLIRVMCTADMREKMVGLIFAHTTTIGIRETETRRYVMDRRIETVETEFGPVRRKVAEGYGVKRAKLEYEDLARIAAERGMSLEEVRRRIEEKL